MISSNILFDAEGHAITPGDISERINEFRDSYKDATGCIIQNSKELDKNGEVFIKCAACILPSFRMTRRGPFKGVQIEINGNVEGKEVLLNCWNAIGARLIEINTSVLQSGFSRDRYLLELSEPEREELITKIWLITKDLLPITMGEKSYGLVGASKILFSVLPEIVLPVDNAQWLRVFKTVDLGDVIRCMVFDIQQWERTTERQLNEMDHSKKLTTLPSVYNVMAMHAREANETENNKI